jgi:hypothetical protein
MLINDVFEKCIPYIQILQADTLNLSEFKIFKFHRFLIL